MKWFIGVDPGQKGAIALINDSAQAIDYVPMPGTVKGIVETVRGFQRTATGAEASLSLVTELAQVMPKQGAVSAFTYGRGFGAIEVVAMCLGIPYHEVRPAIWKKAMKVKADKETSIQECERLFPTVNLIMPRCRIKHDGVAEALLIAEWGRRQGL